mgnify:CR=1 FL=1
MKNKIFTEDQKLQIFIIIVFMIIIISFYKYMWY